MNPVNDMGTAGYLLFWGLTALAAGIFLVRGYQLVRYIYLGRNVGESQLTLGKMLGAVWHLIVQECQFKNVRRKDWAGLGHSFMVWGFLCFVIYYLLFIVIASGFGISATMEENVFYVIWTWVTDIIAPFIVIGVIWAIVRRYFGKPARLKGQLTWEAIFILLTVIIHPITHVGKIATQIAAGHAPAGLGLATPPISALFSNLYTASSSLEAWHAFWFWSHWVFVLLVLAILGFTRYLHVVAAP